MRTQSLVHENDGHLVPYDRRDRRMNDRIPMVAGAQQLINLRLDLHSPTLKEACENLGILPQECKLR